MAKSILLIAVSLLLVGCVLKEHVSLSEVEENALGTTKLADLSIGVDRAYDPRPDHGFRRRIVRDGAYNGNKQEKDEFIAHFRNTGFYREIGYADEISGTPDLLLNIRSEVIGDMFPSTLLCCWEPYFQVLSLYLIPAICPMTATYTMTFRSPKNNKTVEIRVDRDAVQFFGWITIFTTLLPHGIESFWSDDFLDLVQARIAGQEQPLRALSAGR